MELNRENIKMVAKQLETDDQFVDLKKVINILDTYEAFIKRAISIKTFNAHYKLLKGSRKDQIQAIDDIRTFLWRVFYTR